MRNDPEMSSVLLTLYLTMSPISTTTFPPTIQTVRIGNQEMVARNTGTTPPEAIDHGPPEYTEEARALGIEGTVTVRAAFDVDGNATVLGIVQGLGHGLDERALAAVESWRFRPAYRSGAQVGVIAEVDVEFRLNRATAFLMITRTPDGRPIAFVGGVHGIGASIVGVDYSHEVPSR